MEVANFKLFTFEEFIKLLNKGMGMCVICNTELETVGHLFFTCCIT